MTYTKTASVAVAAGVMMTVLTPVAASADTPAQAAAKRVNLNFGALHPAPYEKSEAKNTFKTTAKGKVKIALLSRHGKGSIGLRLISCKGRKGLTSWQQMKKVNRQYTFSRVLKKNTCFKVQSGRSWVNSASGYVNGYVKWV